MAKVKITKTVKAVDGPSGKILTDDQVETWSDFAQKNQNLNFDQKWDAFSKNNPKFGATKQDLRKALDMHEDWLTNTENERREAAMNQGFRTSMLGEKQRVRSGDVFMPLYENGKLVGRYGAEGKLLDKYVKPSQITSGILPYRQIPNIGDVDMGSFYVDREKGIAKVITGKDKDVTMNLNDLRQHPEWKGIMLKIDTEDLRNKAKSNPVIFNSQMPSIFKQ